MVCSLISATEQPVSNSTRMGCILPSWGSSIKIIGWLPLAEVLGFLDEIPALGSSPFRFQAIPHISVEALDGSVVLPPELRELAKLTGVPGVKYNFVLR